MSDYIKRESALAFQNELEPVICKSVHSRSVYSATRDDDLVRYINSIPAANVAPVIHGKWKPHKTMTGKNWWECSVCGFVSEHKVNHNYCPNCGAKMNEVDE